ncbi:MAG: hypothetical protein HQM14_03385 [SAR324 cluster bacterium]|nr:hypothetical protein [SAR324 cluster bacterium]
MKLKIALLISGYCVVITSSLLISWEHGIGATALIGVLHSIIATLKKNGNVILLDESFTKSSSKKKSSATKSFTKPSTSKKEAASELAGVNSNVFAKFQSSLQGHQKPENSEQKTKPVLPKKKQAPVTPDGNKVQLPLPSGLPISQKNVSPASSAPSVNKQNPYEKAKADPALSFSDTLGMEREDRVKLSKRAKQTQEDLKPDKKSETPAPSQTKPSAENNAPPQRVSPVSEKKLEDQEKKTADQLNKILENIDDDLFADVQIVLPSEGYGEKEDSHTVVTTDLFDEGLGAVLQEYHSPEEKSAEAEALLKMAKSSFKSGHTLDAKASLDNYFLIQHEIKQSADWEIQYLYAQVCLKLGEVATANEYFSEITKQGLAPTHPDYCKILESMAESLEAHQMHEEVLPLLYDLLNYYRQQLDRAQMDVIYDRIEQTLEELGDDERLIRTFKNHLEIKRILKDQYGESRLLDLIGNRYYKMGEKELSRKYYEDNLHLKALIEKVESP